MKPLKAKSKARKSSAKFGKVKFCAKDAPETIDPDFTVLRKPVDTSVSSLHQVSKLLETGSDEVKAILAYECDIVYECRICRSLFRSLVNLISHKRVYCKEKFNVTLNRSMLQCYDTVSECISRLDRDLSLQGVIDMPLLSRWSELFQTFDKDAFIRMQEPKQAALKEMCKNDRILRSHVPREEKKDLTAVIDMLMRKQNTDNNVAEVPERFNSECIVADKKGTMRKLDDLNGSTMHQDVLNPMKTQSSDVTNNELRELQRAMNGNPADYEERSSEISQVEKSDSPVQIYGSDEENGASAEVVSIKNLPCTICNAKFSTKKTLAVHMKTLHTSHRMCYPCPCCASTFANTWSVYRHLFKVHRKTNEQVRKLRQQIQEKAFRKETAGVEDFERDNQCNKLVLSGDLMKKNDTQEWIDHLESDELQRCGGCGKRFDRKAALSSHLQYCQRRLAVCDNGSKIRRTNRATIKAQMDTGGEEITNEIVTLTDNMNTESVNVIVQEELLQPGASSSSSVSSASSVSNASISISSDTSTPNETMIRVQAVSTLSKEDWAAMDTGQALTDDISEIDVVAISSKTTCDEELQQEYERPSSSSSSSNASDAPEIIYTSMDNVEVVKLNNGAKKRKIVNLETDSVTDSTEDISKSTVQENSNSVHDTSEMDRTSLMEERMAAIANLRKLQCLPCKRKFTSMTNLRRHIAIHIGWNRYHCKLCDFKCFAKCDCVAHCNKIHNAQNNRNIIADMVMEIPQDQYTCNKNIVMDITNIEETVINADPVVLEEAPKQDVDAHISESNLSAEMEQQMSVSDNNDVPTEEPVSDDKTQTDTKDDEANVKTNNEANIEEVNAEARKNSESDKSSSSSQRILDSNPDLRRMVMEVIFGSESNSDKQSDYDASKGEDKFEEVKKRLQESSDGAIFSEYSCKGANTKQERSKPQRPVRNRVKPVKKDFIYDLKDVAFRRESTRGGYKTFHRRMATRMQPDECQADIQEDEAHSMSLYRSDILKHKAALKVATVNIRKTVMLSEASKVSIPQKSDVMCTDK